MSRSQREPPAWLRRGRLLGRFLLAGLRLGGLLGRRRRLTEQLLPRGRERGRLHCARGCHPLGRQTRRGRKESTGDERRGLGERRRRNGGSQGLPLRAGAREELAALRPRGLRRRQARPRREPSAGAGSIPWRGPPCRRSGPCSTGARAPGRAPSGGPERPPCPAGDPSPKARAARARA
jgi:hypothetical protein